MEGKGAVPPTHIGDLGIFAIVKMPELVKRF